MIIAGPCLYTELSLQNEILETARELRRTVDFFRCKLWGGGTTPEKYCYGVGESGIDTFKEIQKFLPVCTEVHNAEQWLKCDSFSGLWIGARNCQNYTLLKNISKFQGNLFIKRNPGMTIDEMIGIYDIMAKKHFKKVYLIERGINTFDRQPDSRWSPDLKGMIRVKNERPDVFDRIMIDCSHSAGKAEYIEDIYKAFKTIGVNHFMFECWSNKDNAVTDVGQALSVDELKRILA